MSAAAPFWIRSIAAAAACLLALQDSICAGEPVFIVNKGEGITSLKRQDVENILLGKKVRWDSGRPVKLAILGEAAQEFPTKLVGRSSDQLANLWKKLVFTGQGVMPKIFQTESEMIHYVASTPGGCGYANVDKGAPVTAVTFAE